MDEFLPTYTVNEHHSIDIHAPAAVIFANIRTTDFAATAAVRLLFWLRNLPRRAVRGRTRTHRPVTVDTFIHSGGVLLGERPREELLLGIVGQFWRARGRAERLDPDGFRRFNRAGYAKAVIGFSLTAKGAAVVNLATETRVLCLDRRSRWLFRLYWLAIAPFSGHIRRHMLRAIRRRSESLNGPAASQAGRTA